MNHLHPGIKCSKRDSHSEGDWFERLSYSIKPAFRSVLRVRAGPVCISQAKGLRPGNDFTLELGEIKIEVEVMRKDHIA